MQSGWFSKRLSFNTYIFQIKDGNSIKVHGNDTVILELVEYDVHVTPKDFFSIVASRAREWTKALQGYIFPAIIKFHQSPETINCSTDNLVLWRQYEFNQALKDLVLDRPTHPRAKELFQDQNWIALISEFRVSAEALSQYISYRSKEVMMAFMLNTFLGKMEQKSVASFPLQEVTVPEDKPDKYSAMQELIRLGLVKLDEKNGKATLPFLKKTKPIEKPTFPSWHRFIRKRLIPNFAFEIASPDFGQDPTRIRLEIETRFRGNVDCVQQAVSKYVNPAQVYLHVNCYTRDLVAVHKETKKVVRLVECLLTDDTYVVDGERLSYAEVYKNYRNCHPMNYEDLSSMAPGCANVIICVDAYTPDWVLLDAHVAARSKTLICVYIKNSS